MQGSDCFVFWYTVSNNGLNHVLAQQQIPTEQLYTIDLICHGTPSVLIWRNLLRHYEKQQKSLIKECVFRDKSVVKWDGRLETTFKFKNNRTISSEYHGKLFITI